MKQPTLNDGEVYAGALINPDGTGHRIILLPGDNDDADWQTQVDWAKSIGGDLPSRPELAHLYAHLKQEFRPYWYWSNEQHESYSDSAWIQDFDDGRQSWSRKDIKPRARAVRRVFIGEYNMSDEKMRAEFEKAHEHIYRQFDCRHSGNYTNSFIQAKWEAWKACAAIKDAEIADLKMQVHVMSTRICCELTDAEKEIAARDLMIKELREAIIYALVDVPREIDDSVIVLKEALAKSEHHNFRALEKMLLEARIGMLDAVSGRKLHGGVMHTREYVNGYNAKVAETNKILANLKAKLIELNKE